MTHRYVPKLIILGFCILTAVMVFHSLSTTEVFGEETNNYIVELHDGMSMKSGIGLQIHVVFEEIMKIGDNTNG